MATGAKEDADARIAQARAWAEREVERKSHEAREAGLRLLELEAERARERAELDRLHEEHRVAHETIRAMQQTRLWRLGAAYWRLRDAFLRRG